MGGRLSRLVIASAKPAQSGSGLTARGLPGEPGVELSTSLKEERSELARSLAKNVQTIPRTGAEETPNGSEWAKLLNDMSGTISSKPWTSAVAPNSLKSKKGIAEMTHVAVRSEETKSKLPKSAAAKPAEPTETGGTQNVRAGDRDSAEPSQPGALTQNEILDIYHLLRADPTFSRAEQIASRYGVSLVDLKNMAQFTRPFMSKEEYGLSRGFYDPQNGIERFEDLK
jgi:hypothetical protein